MNLVFWNINNNKEAFDIIRKIDVYDDNLLIAFAEYWEISDYIHETANGINYWIDDIYKRVGFINSNYVIVSMKNYKYYSNICINYKGISIDLFIVHLKGKNNSESSSESINSYISQEIIGFIEQKRLEYVIVIGDFNLPHYSSTMLDHFKFNSTSYYNDRLELKKTFDGITRMKFYNPISALNGDLSDGPPGTYYYNIPNQAQAWHIFDNALISYKLARYLVKTKCKILNEISGIKLLNKEGFPNKKYSDHLPINICIEKGE